MRNRLGIKPELLHFSARALVVFWSCGIREEKFRSTFGRISFDRHHNSGPDKYSVVARLGGYEGTLFDSITLPQFGGNDDCATFAHFYGIHRSSVYQKVRNSGNFGGNGATRATGQRFIGFAE